MQSWRSLLRKKKQIVASLVLLLTIAALIDGGQWTRGVLRTLTGYDYFVTTTEGQPIQVRRAIDGDTVELINGDHLRYIGIDTPEEFDERKPVQCFAVEAAAANHKLVAGKHITFYKDMTEKDQYGRWLGFVYLTDGTFVNRKLVEEGYGFAYPYKPDVSKAVEFASVEADARANKRGLWSACEVHWTTSGRAQTNAVEKNQ